LVRAGDARAVLSYCFFRCFLFLPCASLRDRSLATTRAPLCGERSDGRATGSLGLLKTAVGAAAGGAIGVLLFRSGGGWRSACAAAGAGVALGSTYERVSSGVLPPPRRRRPPPPPALVAAASSSGN
jgi:hypothetical protein